MRLLATTVLCLSTLALTDCASHVQGVAQKSGHIQSLAQDSESKAESLVTSADQAVTTGQSLDPELVKATAEKIVEDQQAIQDAAEQILTRDVPHLDDKVPYWQRLLKVWAGVAGAGVVLALLIYLGVGRVARPLFQAIGMFIPRAVNAAAKIDAEAVVDGHASEAQHRAITARRTSEPLYDKLFKRHKAAAEQQKGGA